VERQGTHYRLEMPPACAGRGGRQRDHFFGDGKVEKRGAGTVAGEDALIASDECGIDTSLASIACRR